MAWNDLIVKVGMDSSGFTSGTSTVKRSVAGLQSGMLTLSRTISDQKAKLAELGRAGKGASTQYKELKADIARNRDILSSMNTELRNTVAATGKAGMGMSSFSGLVGAAGAAFAAWKLVDFTRDSISLAASMEQNTIAIGQFVGGAEKAAIVIKELRNFAAKTPFKFEEIAESAKRLLAFGVAGEDVTMTLRRLGDIAAGTGKPLGEISLIYGQVLAKGKLQGEEVLQFAEKGVPLLQSVADVLGKTTAETSTLISKGKVGFPIVQEAIRRMTEEGGKFFELTSKQSQSLSGLLSTLSDAGDEIKLAFAEAFVPIIKEYLPGAISFAKSFAETLASVINSTIKLGKQWEAFFVALNVAKKAGVNSGTALSIAFQSASKAATVFDSKLKDVKKTSESIGSVKEINVGGTVKQGVSIGNIDMPKLDMKPKRQEVIITPVIDAARMTAVVDGIKQTFTDADVMRIGYGAGIQYITGMETGIASREIKLDIQPPKISQEMGILAKLDAEFSAAENRFKVFGDQYELLQQKLSATTQAINSSLEIKGGASEETMNEIVGQYDTLIAKVEKYNQSQARTTQNQALMQDAMLTMSSAAAESFAAIATGSQKSGDAFKDFAIVAVKSLLKVIQAQLVTAAAAQIADGSSKYGWYGLIIAAGAIAGIYAMIDSAGSQAKGVKLAKGGAAFGETLATIGDNPNARFDPEVVAPLSKIENMINVKGGQHLTGTFVVRGPDLVLALDNAERYMGKARK